MATTNQTDREPLIQTTLDNGLTVIVRQKQGAPIGSFWVWYRVGGRNEVPGITGISHWAEHMLFKGTEALPAGEIFRQVSAAGGTLNGFTWVDYTTYFETLPIDQIDLALTIESDRMIHARFDPDEVASERTVIISERQGNENQPVFFLREEVNAAAFRGPSIRARCHRDISPIFRRSPATTSSITIRPTTGQTTPSPFSLAASIPTTHGRGLRMHSARLSRRHMSQPFGRSNRNPWESAASPSTGQRRIRS